MKTQNPVTLVTLGPTGTCHERAAREYMRFQGVEDSEVEFIGDFLDGLEKIRGKDNAFLVQCSAHPLVHKVTERYWDEIFVVDTFIYPTKALAVLRRREAERPRTLGLVPATAGYIDSTRWEEIIDVQSKPIVAEELLAGRYEAGLTTSNTSPPTPTSSASSRRSAKSTRPGWSTAPRSASPAR
jgi:hypothetical protein